MFFALQNAQPFIITIVQKPAPQVTLSEVLLSSLGVVGASVLLAATLGAVLALALVQWNRRHRPEDDRLPSVSPFTPGPVGPRSSQVP